MFGDVPLLMQMLEPFDAKAAADSQVLSIDAKTLLDLLASRPALNQRWLVSMADRMSRLQQRLAELLAGGLETQIGALLVNRAETQQVSLSQSTIAKLLGARRSSVNRILRQMEDDGIVKLSYRNIRITDPAALVTATCLETGHLPDSNGLEAQDLDDGAQPKSDREQVERCPEASEPFQSDRPLLDLSE